MGGLNFSHKIVGDNFLLAKVIRALYVHVVGDIYSFKLNLSESAPHIGKGVVREFPDNVLPFN